MLSTTSPVTAPPKISVILAAGQPSSCRYIVGIKGNASPPLITTALGIALVMTAVCRASLDCLGDRLSIVVIVPLPTKGLV
jgi:hypothetical protein